MTLCLLLAFSVIISTWRMVDNDRVNFSLPAPKHHVNTLAPIANQHLFGIFNKALVNAPRTTLALTLEGAITGQQNYAIIRIHNQPAKVFHVGQSIGGVATLKKIENTKVIIAHDGQLESLPLPVKFISSLSLRETK